MSDVSVWTVYAYKGSEPSETDERRACAEWQLEDVFRWARVRGYDTILFERTSGSTAFEKEPSPPELRHTYGQG